MIGDARNIVRGTMIEADLCILGAGAAGITLALELLRSDMRIVLLEAGGTAEEPEAQALYEGEVADASLHSPPDKYRQRRFGGSTTIWGGRCVPLRANPTLTIVALAIRLARHIEEEARPPIEVVRRSESLASAHSHAHGAQPVLLAETLTERPV
jgi:choline dehydrogenase-like flavoprotein